MRLLQRPQRFQVAPFAVDDLVLLPKASFEVCILSHTYKPEGSPSAPHRPLHGIEPQPRPSRGARRSRARAFQPPPPPGSWPWCSRGAPPCILGARCTAVCPPSRERTELGAGQHRSFLKGTSSGNKPGAEHGFSGSKGANSAILAASPSCSGYQEGPRWGEGEADELGEAGWARGGGERARYI